MNAVKIIKLVKNFVSGPENTLKKWDDEPAWSDPLVGFSNANDSLYQESFKKYIGNFFIRPEKYLEKKYPSEEFTAEDSTVVSWILPQTEKTKKKHRGKTHFPSERWVRSRIFGEEFNVKLREHVVNELERRNIKAVAPTLSPSWENKYSDKFGMSSTWSSRHAAYAAGLGTFGICDGLITKVGKAVRVGSVIIDSYIPPDERSYNDPYAYCLYYQKGTCLDCVKRCPIGAVTVDGHDKSLCDKYIDMTRKYVKKHYDFVGYGCGFCQTGVKCESSIPTELKQD